jgi:hypothetical protein
MNFCPYCGKDTSGFTRCPHCGADISAPRGSGGASEQPLGPASKVGDEWGKTTVMESAPRFDSRKRARFDQGREFYMPIDETRTGGSGQEGSGTRETLVAGQTSIGEAGDKTIIERSRQPEPDDATVIVRGSRRGVTGPLAYIVERSGVRAGKVHLLRGETSVGRGSDNDVILGDDSVSRHHAKIRLEDGEFVFWDLASVNYSFVVGADGSRSRIVEPRHLVDGDKIDLGQARISFLLVDQAGAEGNEP